MVRRVILLTVFVVLLVLVGAGIYGASLNQNPQGNQSTTGTANTSTRTCCTSSSSSSPTGSTTVSSTCTGTCTTIEAIEAGTFTSATDKMGDGGTTVTVRGLQVLYVQDESDGDWHVAVTDGKVSVFITEIIPRDQAAEGRPAVGSFIDETGTPYCDTVHQTEMWHGNTCWEIHPATAWSLSSAQIAVTAKLTAQALNVNISYALNPITIVSLEALNWVAITVLAGLSR